MLSNNPKNGCQNILTTFNIVERLAGDNHGLTKAHIFGYY